MDIFWYIFFFSVILFLIWLRHDWLSYTSRLEPRVSIESKCNCEFLDGWGMVRTGGAMRKRVSDWEFEHWVEMQCPVCDRRESRFDDSYLIGIA